MNRSELVDMVKHFTRTAKYFLLILLFAVLTAALWLQGGAKDLRWAKGWLQTAMNPSDAPYEITFSDVYIEWSKLTEFGDVHVKNIKLARKDGPVFASLPDVLVTLDPLGFLPGRRALHGVEIEDARLFLKRSDQGELQLGVEGVEGALPVDEFAAFFASDAQTDEKKRGRLPFRELTLSHASLLYSDEAQNKEFVAKDFNLRLGRSGRNLSGNLRMPFTYGGKPGDVEVALYTLPLNYQRVLNARLDALPAELLCQLAGCGKTLAMRGTVSGKILLKQQAGEPIDEAEVTLTMQKAVLEAPRLFADPLRIRRAGVLLRADEGLRRVVLEGATLELADTSLSGTAQALKQEDGWYLQGEAACSKLDIRKLYKYWPLPLSPDSRAWVTTQLKAGHAERGTIRFAVTPEDMAGDHLRDEAIDATVVAKGLEVAYLPGFPNVTGADGVVKFSGKRIHIDLERGALLSGTVIEPSVMDFTDLDNPNTPVTTALNVRAPAADVVEILRQPMFTFDDAIPLNPATIQGQAKATLNLSFDAFSESTPENADPNAVNLGAVSYDITAELSEVGQPNLLDGRDIRGLSGQLKASDTATEFSGNVKLEGGTNVALTLLDKAGETSVTAKGLLARSQFKNFGIPEIPQLGEGAVGLDLALAVSKDTVSVSRAAMDLTPMAIDLDMLSWRKKAGEKASLSLLAGANAQQFKLKLDAPGLSLGDASLQLTPAMDDVASLQLPRVKTATNDFSLDYARSNGGYRVVLKGDALDISDAYAGQAPEAAATNPEAVEEKPLENSLLGDFPALDLTLDLKQFSMVKTQPFTNVKGYLRCDVARCQSANISANTGKATIAASIGKVQGVRQFNLTSSDAGDFLRALDVSDRMFGGTLELRGRYDDSKTPGPFSGRLYIDRFKLRNSEILARIISIGSLSGLMNVLTGEGIDFKKISANIDAVGGVVQATKGRAESNALGLTLEGSVDTNRSQINMKGVVVPANSLNSLFGKIPVIGALAGGEGEGLIAFNYSIKGALDDPEVMVNPLSGLTPGFLRGIFTLGDDSATPLPTGNAGKGEAAKPATTAPAAQPWPTTGGRRARDKN